MRPDTSAETLVASILNLSHDMERSRSDLIDRGLARAHDEYLKDWRKRLKDAFRASPMAGVYLR